MTITNLPEHIAIIMDGNGRWAKKRFLPRNEGHRRGVKALEDIIDYAEEKGIKYLTVYAFSTENWRRPESEVNGLMGLFRRYLDNNIKTAGKKNLRFNVIGDLKSANIPEDIKEKINQLKEITKDKTGICFNMAFNYGGRDEVKRALQKIAQDAKDGKITVEAITEELISGYLDTSHMPDPDLMIRTSGEERTSNFLPWQLAYSEFYFTDCLWPDFTKEEFDKALEVYNTRKRRFGKSE
ncbi:isoprenyl transferase [Cellulosilyticum ruminicola]|uniref:isoprenyl transferase n=1 Tax=Cellulosilyticum ruminicola TaxID=425254 RepID=UPI0006D05DD4|nr:isoprenyl transferase [Cellulosilyticum ruminicola]